METDGRENDRMLCPGCLKSSRESVLKQYIINDDYYFIMCKNCSYMKECEGVPRLTEEDLEEFGLPGELSQKMDIYEEDLGKIIRLALVDYWNKIFLEDKKNVQYLQKIDKWITQNSIVLKTNINCLNKMAMPSDITPDFEKKVKEAFNMIESYSFPEDLVNRHVLFDKKKSCTKELEDD